MQLLVASGNAHKVAEIAELLQGSGWQVLSLQDFPDLQLPPEDAPEAVTGCSPLSSRRRRWVTKANSPLYPALSKLLACS